MDSLNLSSSIEFAATMMYLRNYCKQWGSTFDGVGIGLKSNVYTQCSIKPSWQVSASELRPRQENGQVQRAEKSGVNNSCKIHLTAFLKRYFNYTVGNGIPYANLKTREETSQNVNSWCKMYLIFGCFFLTAQRLLSFSWFLTCRFSF